MKEARDVTKLQGSDSKAGNFISTRNACKLCAPLGASIVFRGIEGCIPLIHGSQGCSTYIRRYVISHFKEPIDIASSNFSESSAIFGGGDNLKKALDNVGRQYRPEVIGIATTCLSETIGDDVALYLNQYKKEKGGEPIPVLVHASTPSYRGTHMEGYHEAIRAVVEALAEGGPRARHLNLIPGFLSSEDLRHLKEILSAFSTPFTMLPDYSETLDGESWSEYQKLSTGGTTKQAITGMGRAVATIHLGKSAAGPNNAAALLHEKFGVEADYLSIPIGIRQTDLFMDLLSGISGVPVPSRYRRERGRLVDSYIDGHKYVFGKRAVIYGETDFVVSMASFLDEIGVVPVLCATGARTGRFRELLSEAITHRHDEVSVFEESDFAGILDAGRAMAPDIILGSSKGYRLSRELGIPLVRVGFPIHDRIGGQRLLHVGYRGTQQLFDRVVNGLIEHAQTGSAIGYSYI
ncbi:MAG TPA: nitrogenase component 1 [Syntrophorhabdaceae bacterium]|jgi:nitrogenase molybdenum-iron protein NifN